MSVSIDLSGRVALVTGASSGLGAQFARTLQGWRLWRCWRAGASSGSRPLGRIEGNGGDAHVVALDVTDVDSIRAAVAHAETEVGTLDILINNSGVSTTQKLTDVTEADYDFVMDTNTRGAFFVAQEVGKAHAGARAWARAPGTSSVGASSTSPPWPGCGS